MADKAYQVLHKDLMRKHYATFAAQDAVRYLQKARDACRQSGCRRTLARIRLALSSARGGVRAAGYRYHRAQQACETYREQRIK